MTKPRKTAKTAHALKDQDSDLAALINLLFKSKTSSPELIERIIALLEESQKEQKEENTALCPNAQYALKRLIKGSASLSESVRMVSCISFHAVLGKFASLMNFRDTLNLVNSLLSLSTLYGTTNPSRGEDSAVHSAKLGCYRAIMEVFPKEIHGLNQEIVGPLTKDLIEISQARSFLAIPAFEALLLLQENPFFCEELTKNTGSLKVNADTIWLAQQTPAIAFILSVAFPDLHVTFTMENIDSIINMLVDTISFLPTPHDLWSVMILAFENPKARSQLIENLDATLLGSDSLQKKIVGVQVFASFATLYEDFSLPSRLLELVNSVGPSSCKSQNSSKSQRPLNIAMSKFIADLTRCEVSEENAVKLLELSNFRSLPRSLVCKVLSNKSRVDRYLENTSQQIQSGPKDKTPNHFDALRLIFDLELIGEAEKSHYWQEIINLLINTIKESGKNEELITRIQSFLLDGIKILKLDHVIERMGFLSEEFNSSDDEVIEDSLKTIKKAKKLLDQKGDFDEMNTAVLSILKQYIAFAKFWLFIDPIIVADSLEDVKDTVKDIVSKKGKMEMPAPDFVVDLLLKLLSNNSAFVRSFADFEFKKIIPYMTTSAVTLFIEILKTKSSNPANDDLMEELEEEEEEEGESEDDNEEQLALFQNLQIDKRTFAQANMPEEGESEEEEVFLDDADEAELAMFDSKLAEIFKHKKEAKLSPKLSTKAMNHFKARILHWARFTLESKPVLPIEVRACLMFELVSAMPVNAGEEEKGSNLLQSIIQIVKIGCKQNGAEAFSESISYAQKCFDLLLTTHWENQLMWSAVQPLVIFLLRSCPPGHENFLTTQLSLCWAALKESKKMQKSSFASSFAFWTRTHPTECLSLVQSKGFVSDFVGMNAHSRDFLLTFLRDLIAANHMPNADAIFIPIVRELMTHMKPKDPKEAKGQIWSKLLGIFSLLTKIHGASKFYDPQFFLDLANDMDPNSSSRIKQAIASIKNENRK